MKTIASSVSAPVVAVRTEPAPCVSSSVRPLIRWSAVATLVAGVGAFHLAYAWRPAAFLVVVFLFALWRLAYLPTARGCFHYGLAAGLAINAPQLGFFWTLFGPSAAALWLVLAFWIGLFVLLAHRCRAQFGAVAAAVLAPFLWLGTEFFRSELYYLRFSWLSPGYVFGEQVPFALLHLLGVYGVGFLLMAVVTGTFLFQRRHVVRVGALVLIALAVFTNWPRSNASTLSPPGGEGAAHAAPTAEVQVAGVQMEFPAELEVPLVLDKLIKAHPETQLLVLSEYTFDGPVPERVKAWCRRQKRHLIVGGKDPIAPGVFYNTAFVINPAGEIVFKQVKAVPIQFFQDGRPAPEQHVWESPWGKLGICICYDLSYTRVIDTLVRLGAQAIIAPTMDVADWGEHQHRLHGRIAPARAAEYGLPIFRVASSGVSQLVDRTGMVMADAPFAAEGKIISGTLRLGAGAGNLPLDRRLGPLSVLVTIAVMVALVSIRLRMLLAKFNAS